VMAVRTRPAPPATLQAADHVDEAARSRGVTLAATCMATIRGSSGFLTFAVAFDFKNPHHPAPAWWYGLVIVGALVGGFAGNLIGPVLRRIAREDRILVLTLGGLALVAFGAAVVNNRLAVTVLAFAVGMADGIGQLAFDAIVQRDGSEGTRARSFARFEATFQLLWVVGALIPVVVGLPTHLILPKRVFSLVIALGAAGAVLYDLGGRRVGATARREPGPGRAAEIPAESEPWPAAPEEEPASTEPWPASPPIWSAVRGGPPADPTAGLPRTPPIGTPATAAVEARAPDPGEPPPGGFPRRNPRRSGRQER